MEEVKWSLDWLTLAESPEQLNQLDWMGLMVDGLTFPMELMVKMAGSYKMNSFELVD